MVELMEIPLYNRQVNPSGAYAGAERRPVQGSVQGAGSEFAAMGQFAQTAGRVMAERSTEKARLMEELRAEKARVDRKLVEMDVAGKMKIAKDAYRAGLESYKGDYTALGTPRDPLAQKYNETLKQVAADERLNRHPELKNSILIDVKYALEEARIAGEKEGAKLLIKEGSATARTLWETSADNGDWATANRVLESGVGVFYTDDEAAPMREELRNRFVFAHIQRMYTADPEKVIKELANGKLDSVEVVGEDGQPQTVTASFTPEYRTKLIGALKQQYNSTSSANETALFSELYKLRDGMGSGRTQQEMEADARALFSDGKLSPAAYKGFMDASDKLYTTQEDISREELADLHAAAAVYNPKDDPDRSNLVALRHEINRVQNTQDRQFLLSTLDASVEGKPGGVHADMIKAESTNMLRTDLLEGRITNPEHRSAISLLTLDAYTALHKYPQDGEKIVAAFIKRADLITKGATIEQVRNSYRWPDSLQNRNTFARPEGSAVQYDELKPGERYRAPDGTMRTKR
jgi:hypothetical protein